MKAAKPDEEWSIHHWHDAVTGPRERELAVAERFDGHGDPPSGWTKTTYPSLVQKIGRRLDRGKPQCFACHETFQDWRKGLERAHIIAASAGGEDVPENFVLLCSECHADAPMTVSKDLMLEWVDRGPASKGWRLAAQEAAIEAEALALANYKAYGETYSSLDEFQICLSGADFSHDNIERTMRELCSELKPDFHFGQKGFSPATHAYLMLECHARVAFRNPERTPQD